MARSDLETRYGGTYGSFAETETCTVTPQNDATLTPITGVKAIRAVENNPAGGASDFQPDFDSCAFAVWRSTLARKPKRTWKLTDGDGVVWTIQSVSENVFEPGYILTCEIAR